MILKTLLRDIDRTLERIEASKPERYEELQRSLFTCDVSVDPDYRRLFNGYYRMQRRPHEWYGFFFELLENQKGNASISFRDILERVYRAKGRVEPSFCSKLVATIRPDMPVYDKYVRENLSLVIPKPHEGAGRRVEKFISVYEELTVKQRQLMCRDEFATLKCAFDQKLPGFAHFTDTKKLDLFLWQYRKT